MSSRSRALTPLWLALASCACGVPPEEASPTPEVRDLTYFLRRLRDVQTLPELEPSTIAMSSTWDRSGGNSDGWDFKSVDGDTNVLLDVDGPGCIHRLYTGLLGAWVEGTRIQIFLDHAARPLFDMPVNEFFSEIGGAFPYPLLSTRTYPGSHVPIPFATHCRVQLVSPPRAWGVYWQLTYSSYPAGTPVETLRWPPSGAARAELQRVLETWLLAQALPPAPLQEARVVQRDVALAPGSSETIMLAGCGVIRELRAAVTPRSALRDVSMTLRWDGHTAADVALAVGDFFGHGAYGDDRRAEYSSLLLSVAEGEGISRLPMPYDAGARLTFTNRGATPVELRARISVEERQRLPASWGRFRATWQRRAAGLPSAPRVGPGAVPVHPVLEARGAGKYVGVVLQVDWPYPGQWWGEGDWIVWADEEGWPPRYHGTGSEEYFNSGFMQFDRKAVSGFVEFAPGPVTVYSFHLNDAFQFQRRLRAVVETMGSFGGEETIARQHPVWGSAAFWYAGVGAEDVTPAAE
jgi:hypothetical protein